MKLLCKEQEGPLHICFRSLGSCRCEIRIHKPFTHRLFLSVFIQESVRLSPKPPSHPWNVRKVQTALLGETGLCWQLQPPTHSLDIHLQKKYLPPMTVTLELLEPRESHLSK